jgi:hypothetical protein
MRLLILGGMLMLAVSASLTPANARGWFCDNVVCLCQSKCAADWSARWRPCQPIEQYLSSPSLLHLEESRFHLEFCERLHADILACNAKCGRMEGVEHLSLSELRARVKAKEAAQRRRQMPWANNKN